MPLALHQQAYPPPRPQDTDFPKRFRASVAGYAARSRAIAGPYESGTSGPEYQRRWYVGNPNAAFTGGPVWPGIACPFVSAIQYRRAFMSTGCNAFTSVRRQALMWALPHVGRSTHSQPYIWAQHNVVMPSRRHDIMTTCTRIPSCPASVSPSKMAGQTVALACESEAASPRGRGLWQVALPPCDRSRGISREAPEGIDDG